MAPVELLESPLDSAARGSLAVRSQPGAVAADSVVEADLFDEDDLLLEEISIDGMCGVY